ncbi:MAG: prolyl oligopeptidase [Pseudoalteromonas tetraodonis]|jgi:prolyl oligopeptidase
MTSLTILTLAAIGPSVLSTQATAEKLSYPNAREADVVDELHGKKVADPYRWMEEIDSKETKQWVAAQAELAQGYLSKLPGRERIEKRLEAIWDYDKIGMPQREGGRVFYSRQSGLQNQSVLYWREDKPGTAEKVLLDPNQLSEDGTVALSGYSVSDDGKYLAYGLSSSGSDWKEWRVREIESGKDLPDYIRWSKFSGASWSTDGKGFCYSRFDAPAEGAAFKGANYFHKVYYHKLGDEQSQDELLFERKDAKEWNFGGDFTEDGNYLLFHIFTGDFGKNGIFYKALNQDGAEVVELLKPDEASYNYLGNDGATFYFRTNQDAPKGRVISLDVTKPEQANWVELIAEGEHNLEDVSMVGDTLIATYQVDASHRVQLFDKSGEKIRDLDLPGIATVYGFSGTRKDTDCYYLVTSFTRPATIYHYDLTSGKSTIYKAPEVDFDAENFITKQVFYKSKDGTKIPMFICHKKGIELDGKRPVYLIGYGGFDISLTPGFSLSNAVWMEMGGVFAQPNLRGGGEYGQAWHEAGKLDRKQNVFDDFIAAGEWLIENQYTSSKHLAIGGGSNGGLLVGACLTQKPEMFAAAVPSVGVLDMLRFHKWTIGWAWQGEYGKPDEAKDFEYLYRYSPLHNVKDGVNYPATLVMTGDHDDRVFPAHSFKFGARLQAAQGGEAPILIRIETNAGHGAGTPTAKIIESVADKWAFLFHALGVAVPEAKSRKQANDRAGK